LTFGGSPTPDRRLVSEIVERWIALLNLLSASVPTRAFSVSSTSNVDAGAGDASSRPSAFTSLSFGFCACGCDPWPATPSAVSFSHRIFFSATEMPNTSLPGANRSRLPKPPSSRMYSGSSSP
jgi:hypothetical protein